MPRPPVIVVPGPMGLGGQKTQKMTEATLDLGSLYKLYQDYQDRKAKEESAMALADMLGIGKVPSQTAATMTTPEATASGDKNPLAGLATGFVNTPPRYGEQDRAALSKTPEGQKTILDIFQKMNEPEKFTAVPSELGPVMAGSKGNFGKLFPAPKSDSKEDHYTIREKKNHENVKSIRLQSGQMIPEGWEIFDKEGDKQFKFTGASVFRGVDNNWWRWNPTTGLPEVYTKTGNGKYDFVHDASIPVPDAVTKELGRTPGSAIEKGVTLDQIAGNVERISQNFNPDWVGPAAGRYYGTKEAIMGLSDNQSIFYADTQDLADMLLRARSGAQINEQEYNRLSKLVPMKNLPPKVFQERLKRFTEQFSQAIEAWERRLAGGRYMVPGRSQPTKNVIENKGKKVGRFTIKEK